MPTLNKERKTLSSLLLDYDAAKSRLVNYRQKEGSGNYFIDNLVENMKSSNMQPLLCGVVYGPFDVHIT